MARIHQVSVLSVVAVCWLSAFGCSSSNEPTGGGSAGTTSTGATAGTVSTGATAGTTPIASGGGGATGSSGSTSIAGTTAGGASAGGSTSSGGAGGTFSPLCAGLTTAAMGSPAPTKGGACTATDPQLCWKTCGPQSSGYKSETCTNGAYVEASTCSFPPDLDASCYKIPTTVDPSCPATPPQASTACTVAPCTPCNAGGSYLDSTGASKMGWCVCPMPGTSGTSKWSCASTNSWPCPAGKGC
jgi:hypothetical protein